MRETIKFLAVFAMFFAVTYSIMEIVIFIESTVNPTMAISRTYLIEAKD